ncbi:prenyltransferase/squalene oxidase repeat-containing protein [Bdellovibrionota bacterium FG-2]
MRKTIPLLALAISSTLSLTYADTPPPAPTRDDVAAVIEKAQKVNRSLREQDSTGKDFWNLPSYLGTHYLSQFHLLLSWLGQKSTRLSPAILRSRLLNEQLADGSWYAIYDANLGANPPLGDLNATILNYVALKSQGMALDSDPLRKARTYILSRGGIEKSSIFTKIVMALFDNYPWDEIPSIPYIVFLDQSPYNMNDFSQWIGPHLMPIAYLRSMKLSRDLGPDFDSDELWTHPDKIANYKSSSRGRKLPHFLSGDSSLMKKILAMQQPAGSFGGYTVATLLSMIAMQDFQKQMPDDDSARSGKIKKAIQAGLSFTEDMYFNSGESVYKGVLDDGRYWDTALMGISLSENASASQIQDLRPAGEYLVSRQSPNGGFAFGIDFEYAPDTDDTAEIMIFLSRLKESTPGFEKPIKKAVNWLIQMQNKDGGWGAFSKNNTGNALLRSFTKSFEDSADLFDESSPDVTGHTLEALAGQGLTAKNSPAIARAIQYLYKSQDENLGAWYGRWGINYIYGTSAAIAGLIRAGESPDAPALKKATQFMISHQNPDGGFGETSASYDNPKLAGVGISTPSQTAWALITLIEAGLAQTDVAAKAASYLVIEFNKGGQETGRWSDPSTVGTGHPSLIYMNYPSYPYAFPLIALSRYMKALNQSESHPAD